MQWITRLYELIPDGWWHLPVDRSFAVILGSTFAVIAVLLVGLSRTRWGRAKPLTKFVVVSVLLHVWLLMYALGTRVILPHGSPYGQEQTVAVSVEFYRPDEAVHPQSAESADPTLPDHEVEAAQLPDDPPALTQAPPELAAEDLPVPELLPVEEPATDPQVTSPSDEPGMEQLAAARTASSRPPGDPSLESTPDGDSERLSDELVEMLLAEPPQPSSDDSAQPPEQLATGTDMLLPPESMTPATGASPSSAPTVGAIDQRQKQAGQAPLASKPVAPPVISPERLRQIPEVYRLRQAADRWELAQSYGADEDTEAAVAAALRWLATTQSPDGSWIAAEHEAGRETYAYGEFRHGTGRYADTGITGLALLAFLGAGHTHQDGEFRTVVRKGLNYLIRSQMPSGDLAGPKQVGAAPVVLNARMYCHGIATLALGEAYALTQDASLYGPLRKACDYTIRAQDVRVGGWRYMPGDSGDLSQFGWQAMALLSAARAGLAIPDPTARRMRRFLDACAAGRFGGLARYRPHEGHPSRTMTAEALACRLLMNYRLNDEAQNEAVRFIMQELPGQGEDNVYYWYYATLALFQLQNRDWRSWNLAMKSRLLTTQVQRGAKAGSWDPDQLWGGYGGRVYSTALSCMCLEVYYRYLPIYARGGTRAASADNWRTTPPPR